MTLSKRERYIAIATAAVVGLLALDQLVLTPWFDTRAALASELDLRREELNRADQTFDNLRRANRRWADLAGDALKTDAPAAEGQLLNALRDWAQDAGLSLTAVRPDRGAASHGFQQLIVRATASGRMAEVSEFLWSVETADIPVRLVDMQLASRKPGEDDLTLQLALSTIYLLPASVEGGTP